MKYAVLINGAPLDSQAARSAFYFCQSLLAQGHELSRVFFYGPAIHTGNRFRVSAQDESNLTHDWQQFAKDTHTELVLCIAAAQRRGVISDSEAARHGLEGDSMAEGFVLGGLGLLAEASILADRVVTFNG
ncbi:sulfurtransferase complex subunit TusD [Pokkaliibacter sp. CJK22405]|uniref:sulfurtransferase complex subunit TusD n=1 Tax=Pokkaliibacter sp. CJK22405 TaxID=3384615 RepID=UPI003984FFAA